MSDRAAAIERGGGAAYRREGHELQGALVAVDPRNGEIRALVGAPPLRAARLQPRARRAAPAGVGVQALRLRRGALGRLYAREPGGRLAGRGHRRLAGLAPGQLRRRVRRSGHACAARSWRSANAATVRLEPCGRRAAGGGAGAAGGASRRARSGAVARARRGGGDAARAGRWPTRRSPTAGFGSSRRWCGASSWPTAPSCGERPDPKPERVLGEAEAFQITSMLRSVVDGGTGRLMRELGVAGPSPGRPARPTTGRTSGSWGTPRPSSPAVWFGYDAPRAIAPGASGGRLAAPAWAAFYKNGWKEKAAPAAWEPPARIGEPDHRRVHR